MRHDRGSDYVDHVNLIQQQTLLLEYVPYPKSRSSVNVLNACPAVTESVVMFSLNMVLEREM